MTIITTGIEGAPVVSRLELRTFFQDEDVLNLYLLAIDRMQKIDQQDPSSWFQLAAIHGRPYIPFDNVGVKGSFGGYCTHSSILFPTWHRPYLALFEQAISKHVFEIAHEYRQQSDKNRYIAAAQRFRIPYWDWASESTLPDIVARQERITVHAPDGTHTIKNPLYSYKFNPVYSDFGDGLPDEKVWESWQTTLRYPTAHDASGKSDPAAMEAELRNNRLTLRDRTYNILTQTKEYAPFSNAVFLGDGQNPAHFDSLEAIHDQIHGLTGSDGHMGVVDYAAFDPVFWMHHTNVDRIFAIWQALNPNSYVTPEKTDAGTFTTKPGSTENAESPLTPFRESPSKFWDSNSVRDTRTFNYTYPELAKWSSLSPKEKSIRLHQEVNRLYGRTAPVSAAVPSVFSALQTGGGVANVASGPGPQAPLQPSKPAGPPAPEDTASPFEISGTDLAADHWHETPSTADDKPHYHEWIANIVVEKYAVDTSFFVHIFLGDFNQDPRLWGVDPNLVGSHVIFANNATFTGCERCRDAHERRKLVTGTIPLTGILSARLGADHLEPEEIIPYLRKNLHWRVQRHDKTPIEGTSVPSLKVSVGHALVEVPQSAAEFATWGDVQIHTDVTNGRLGGLNAA